MSERTRVPRTRLLASTLLLGGALAAQPDAAVAQSAAEWNRRAVAADKVAGAALARYRAIWDERRGGRLDSVVAGGRTVRFNTAEISPGDVRRVSEGLRRGADELLRRFGSDGVALIGRDAWMLEGRKRYAISLGTVLLTAGSYSSAPNVRLARPVDPELVATFVLHRAGEMLVQRSPALVRYAGWAAFLESDSPAWNLAQRSLALSWSSTGRRCALGALVACREVLAPFDSASAVARYFEPADYRSAVTVARVPFGADSAFFASRRRCLDAADSACARIVDRVAIPDPFEPAVRGTLLSHALHLGGPQALARLADSTKTDALALLAHVAGIATDSLVGSWHRNAVRVFHRSQRLGAGLVGSTAAWAVLLFLLTMRRRMP